MEILRGSRWRQLAGCCRVDGCVEDGVALHFEAGRRLAFGESSHFERELRHVSFIWNFGFD